MRLVSADNLRAEMILGRAVYGNNGETLLQKGMTLRSNLIDKIRQLQIGCVYIEDGFSDEIEIFDVIDETLRRKVISRTKNLFVAIQSGAPSAFAQRAKEINQMIDNIVGQIMSNRDMIVNLIDMKTFDDYTYQHSVNVCVLATVLGSAMFYSYEDLLELAKAALFHDLGKMFISKDIIMKPGPLTAEEFAEMKTHPYRGAMFAKQFLKFSDAACMGIMQHHEQCNGAGYPEGRKDKGISRHAKMIAICDVYDAITSKRSYHEAFEPPEAFEYIMGNADWHFDSDVVNVFLKKIAAYPLGAQVRLSNGLTGLVCENREGFMLRPKVKIFTPENGEASYIDLADMENTSITIISSKESQGTG